MVLDILALQNEERSADHGRQEKSMPSIPCRNLCAQIDIALHNRVTEEKDRLEMTTSQYIASLLTEYYKMKDENAGHLGWRSHDLRHHGKEAAGGSAR